MSKLKPLLSIVITFVAPAVASACSCSTPDVRTAFKEAKAVFAGKAIAVTSRGMKFKVMRSWKGVSASEINLEIAGVRYGNTVAVRTSCDFDFEKGEEYMVYADGGGGGALRAFACSRTAKLARAGDDLKELGEGRRPKSVTKARAGSKD